MNRQLVFVHGRAQEHKVVTALKQEWVTTFEKGLAKSGLALPTAPSEIRFPYYGQTLFDIAGGATEEEAASVLMRGRGDGDTERADFIRSVLEEVRRTKGIDDSAVDTMLARTARERGPLQWNWVQATLSAIDRYLPHASAASIALATNDVYQYLRNPGIAGIIDSGVRKAVQRDVPTVVVSHSLGTVIAYNLLRRDGGDFGWKIPLFVTLGSPLAVTAIRQALSPIRFPGCAARWFNASDPKDVVALRPLDRDGFGVEPTIENKLDVNNHTANHHGIIGYLDNKVVARRIHDALVVEGEPATQ